MRTNLDLSYTRFIFSITNKYNINYVYLRKNLSKCLSCKALAPLHRKPGSQGTGKLLLDFLSPFCGTRQLCIWPFFTNLVIHSENFSLLDKFFYFCKSGFSFSIGSFITHLRISIDERKQWHHEVVNKKSAARKLFLVISRTISTSFMIQKNLNLWKGI